MMLARICGGQTFFVIPQEESQQLVSGLNHLFLLAHTTGWGWYFGAQSKLSPMWTMLLCYSGTALQSITQIGGRDKDPLPLVQMSKAFMKNPWWDSTWSNQQRPLVFHTNTIRVSVIAAAEPLIIDRWTATENSWLPHACDKHQKTSLYNLTEAPTPFLSSVDAFFASLFCLRGDPNHKSVLLFCRVKLYPVRADIMPTHWKGRYLLPSTCSWQTTTGLQLNFLQAAAGTAFSVSAHCLSSLRREVSLICPFAPGHIMANRRDVVQRRDDARAQDQL